MRKEQAQVNQQLLQVIQNMQSENRELKDKLFDQQVKEQVGGADARDMLIPTIGAAALSSADT